MNSYLERLQQELEDATGSASDPDLAQAPDGKWSPAQILEHLLLTYKNTTRGLDKCREQGTPLARRVTLKDRAATLLVVNFGYVPRGRKAPERAMPRGMASDEVRQAIVPELQKMGAAFDECERKFGVRTKLGPPVSWALDRRPMAQVPLGPRAASRATDSRADGKVVTPQG